MNVLNRVGLACVLGLFLVESSFAVTRYVNVSNATPVSPYTNWARASTNIQLAINVAASGDEIQVAPGVYRSTTFVYIMPDKRVTLRSTVSRAAVMDAQRLSSALIISGTNSVVEGFTVRNGLSDNYGGGISLYAPSTVRDCLVTNNHAYGGAGIHIRSSSTVVENCTVQYNLADGIGGGILFYDHSTGRVDNCYVGNNVASNDGGGIYIQNVGAVSNCWIADNSVRTGSGGGVYMYHGGRLVNSVVVSNRAVFRGGGVQARYGGGTLAHCTVVDNLCDGEGGGLWLANDCTSGNSIVYYNTAATSSNMFVSLATASNNCTIPAQGGGCVTNNPNFVFRSTRTLSLIGTSPCIDAGAAAYAVATDYAGNPRPVAGTEFGPAKFDIGAYEYQAGWDAGYQDLGSGWRRLTWFGDYAAMGGGWIWHNKHGFLYPTPGSTRSDIWFFTNDMGWLWTANATYPFLYRASPAAWLWYNGATNPRWFRNMTAGTWEWVNP